MSDVPTKFEVIMTCWRQGPSLGRTASVIHLFNIARLNLTVAETL